MAAARKWTVSAVLELPVAQLVKLLPPYTLHRVGLGPFVGCSDEKLVETVAEGATMFGRDPMVVAQLVMNVLQHLE